MAPQPGSARQAVTTPTSTPQTPPSAMRKLIDPGLRSPATTAAGLATAAFIIVNDTMLMLQGKENFSWKELALALGIAAVSWFARSHNVSSLTANVPSQVIDVEVSTNP